MHIVPKINRTCHECTLYRWMQRFVACLCAQKLGIPFVPAPYSSYEKIQIIFGTVCGETSAD